MKKLIAFIYFAVLALLPCNASSGMFSADSLARKFSVYSAWFSPEKLYVHMDRTYFAADETIWFNGYLVNASSLSKLPPGNYIYAELLDSAGNAVCRVKVKRNGNIFPGYMYLPDNLKSGYYTFRAYTMWQMNHSSEYMFNQRVKILGAAPVKDDEPEASKDLDISFYPEGGRFFSGMKATVGFKAMDSRGRSVGCKGILEDENGTFITPVLAVHDGMGRFSFLPSAAHRYYVKLEDGRRFELPACSAEGASVSLRFSGENIVASVSGIPGGRYILLARCMDMFTPLAEIALEGKPKSLLLASNLFPSGINHLVLVDGNAAIVSERLFFIPDRNSPVCTLSSDIRVPRPHGLIRTNLSLKDKDGHPLDGNCSVSIVRGSFRNHQQDDGLVSYLRLSSELKGHINDPYYYFDQSVNERERMNNIDMLMMIQGWSYYDVRSMVEPAPLAVKLNHLKEYSQTVRGYITQAAAEKMPKNFIFSLLIPRYKFNRFVDVAQARYFTIDSLDFEEKTQFLISITRSGFKRDYAPKWSGDKFASSYKYFPAPGKANVSTEPDKVPLVSEVVQIDSIQAAVVSGTRKDAFDGMGSIGRGVSASDFEIYKNYTLIEYLVERTPAFEFDGENMYNKQTRRFSGEETESEESGQTMTDGEPDGIVKLYVEDAESVWWTYEFVRMEDIETINISTMAESAYGAPNGMVALTLKKGASLGSAEKRDSYIYFVPLGYQKAKSFYSPRYDRGDAHEVFDHRNTVYWSPSTAVADGKAEIEFCNTDQMDYPYVVHIEGLTRDGVPFSGRSILNFEEQSY